MFLFKASVILDEIKKFSPEVLSCCERSLKDNLYDLDFQRLNKILFGMSKYFFRCSCNGKN